MSLLDDLVADGHTDLFVGGEWRPAGDGHRIGVVDPATGELLTDVASGGVEDGLAAVTAAAEAAPDWAATAPRSRSEILRTAFDLMIERADDLAELMVLENGKALPDARGEVVYAAEFFRWFSEEAVRNEGAISTAPAGDKQMITIYQPVGVSVLITPWNFPAAMATRKIGPALAAGCTVILKPASDTPLTALALTALLAEAGVPPGVVNTVPSDRSGEIVPAMLGDPRVRKLSFTGSTEVGRTLLAQAAGSILNTSMELGGNAPFLIFADADIDAAVEGAMVAKMRNGGQACTAANRFYVQAPVAEEFTARFGEAMRALKVGPGLEAGVEVGPVINERARDDIAELVAATVESGATVIAGAEAPEGPGFFYLPTVIASVPADAHILETEIFGPVAPIVEFDNPDEAIEMANSTAHGLISYVYTGDLAQGMRVSEALETGMVGLNRGLVSDPAAPFGGVKQSGIGREGGHHGLLEFLEAKYIATSW
jgi:succinate-semialdehyde dehydrogenase/glutarate-semialdehyde dehydrogenase